MRDLHDFEKNPALRFAHVPLPDEAVATDCEPWKWHDGAWRRFFTVREWQIAAITVALLGEQTHTGVVPRWLYVGGEDQLTGPQRHLLVHTLVEAGRMLDLLLMATSGQALPRRCAAHQCAYRLIVGQLTHP